MATLEDLRKELQQLQEQVNKLEKRVQTVEQGNGASNGSAVRRNSQGSSAAKVPPRSKSSVPRASSATKVKAEKKEREDEVVPGPEVDPKRVGYYTVGKRKVYYVVPSNYLGDEKSESEAPATSLTLEYIYGYNGANCRDNLHFTDKEGHKLLYNIAAVGATFDYTHKTQSFFIGHDEDILSLAKHPNRPIAATGQLDPKGSGKPYVCIWNFETSQQICRIEGYHDRGVIALQFTPDGKYLASIGNDDSHFLALWDWENDQKKPVAEASVAKDDIYGIIFNSYNQQHLEFATFGAKHFKLWTMVPREESKGSANADRSKFVLNGVLVSAYKKTKVIQKAQTCALYLSTGECVAGTTTGELYVFKDRDYERSIKAHASAVGGLCATDDGFASVGADGKILLWKNDGTAAGSFSVTEDKKISPQALDYAKGHFVVGTDTNAIYLVDSHGSKVIMEGHYDEIWGLAVHPSEPLIATGAQDRVVRVWNTATKTVVKSYTFDKDQVHSCAFSPDGKLLAVGFTTGRVAILDFASFTVKHDKRHRKEQIDAIAFSPNGKLLAFGSWDQVVEVVTLETMTSIHLKGHTSSITHLSFSADSKYIASNSRDYEILYWDLETGRRLDRNLMADVEWGDWTNILGWPVRGVFRKGMDGTDVNAVNISGDNSSKERYIASGDDSSHVTLFKYPAGKNAAAKDYGGHSSHVTNVRFSKDGGKFLFSTGGLDCGVFQWKHE